MSGGDTSDDVSHRGFEGLDGDDLEALVRSVSDDDREIEVPPPGFWDTIAVGAGIESEIAPIGEADSPISEADSPVVVAPPSNVRSLPRWVPVLSAAAAIALIAGVIGIGVSSDDGSNADVLATAELDPLVEGFTGTAFFEDSEEGLDLRLDLGELPAEDGFYELWIIKDLETGQMQSLGPISGSGTVAWPDGFDPTDYSVVDISTEPLDGVPTHSGASVLRGELQA